MGMDIKMMEYVVEIARCGSINKAAKNLYLSQPNLSNALKNLEAELGYTLFVRKNSGIQLTNAGRIFLSSAKIIVSEMQKIHQIPRMFTEHKNISLSCTYYSVFMHEFLRFKKEISQEDIEDNFKETGLIQTIQDIIERNYRICLFYCFECNESKYQKIAKKYNLNMQCIASDIPLQVMVPQTHPISRKKSIDVSDLPRYNLVNYQNFDFSDWLQILGLENDHRVLYVFDRGGLFDAVRESGYFSVIIKSHPDYSAQNGCVFLPLVGLKEKLKVFLLQENSYQMNEREHRFVQQLIHCMKDISANESPKT